MKVNSIPSAGQLPPKNKHQKMLLEQVKESLLKLDWPKHPILFSKLRELVGSQQQIMHIVRECIEINSRKGWLINYLYILDYLLTLQSFNRALHRYLVEFYCDLFKHLLWQKHFDGLQTMKIMRKYWLPKIDFNLYAHIHENVLKHFQVNIDWISESALLDLKTFYLEHLRMNINDLYFHLPQLKTLDYQHPPQHHKKVMYKLNNTSNKHPKSQEGNSSVKVQPGKEQKVVQIVKSQNLESIKALRKDKVQPQVELLKRKRDQSQETSISIKTAKRFRYDQQHLGQFTHQQPSKTHKKQLHSKHLYKESVQVQRGPLKGFNFLMTYSCLECLMKFKMVSQLQRHKVKGCKKDLQDKQKQVKQNCVVIKEEDISNYCRECNICYRQLQAEYQNGNWVVFDSIRLTIYAVDTIIHLACQKQVTPQMTKTYSDQQQEQQEQQP